MSTTPREPLLSNDGLMDMMYATEDGKRPSEKVREFYEDLITHGKLRVVEECGYVPADTWCSVCICKGCGEACSDAGEIEPYPHCPHCTRKIKR